MTWTDRILTLKGFHYLATRFGSSSLRKRCFDARFAKGDWNFATDPNSELVGIVEKYANGGNILMLGCGTASLAGALKPESFNSLLGLDISQTAIERANTQAGPRIEFKCADMLHYELDRTYDVILLSESIYYVSPLSRKSLLLRLAKGLTPKGHIIVTIAQPLRFRAILSMIRSEFKTTEDRKFMGSGRHLLVFR